MNNALQRKKYNQQTKPKPEQINKKKANHQQKQINKQQPK